AELAAVHAALSRPAPATVVVSGVAGVGKSRLLAEVATHSSVPVIAARAFCAERDDAWALARSLLREALALDCEAPRSLPERPALGREVLAVGLEALSPAAIGQLVADPGLARAISEATDGTPHALGELIRALAQEGAVLSDEKGRWRPRRPDAASRARAAGRS